uniref:NAD(P)-binding protein n=1 Tax=Mycena chlorophos TaxID=658473 RepID=A0ABQ0LYE5_MYCCL|nr:NAD(P)-binding protein [Mycena chlorophos]
MSNTPSFEFASTSEEVASAFASEIKGKNVLITGTSINSLGFEAARVCAKYGANLVIITGQNENRLKLAHEALQKEVSHGNFRPLRLDLSLFSATRAAAEVVNAYPEHIDLLLNNAASNICPFELTADGLERQLQTDHVGPFLFTALVFPKLLASPLPHPRVVWTASGAHGWCDGVDLAELEKPNEATYTAMRAYAQSKTANILTAREFARREQRVTTLSLSPGAVATNFVTNQTARATLTASNIVDDDGQPNLSSLPWKTMQQGVSTIIVAAFDPSLTDKSGSYLRDCVVDNTALAPHAIDDVHAGKLWALTERLVGVKFL